MTRRSHIVLLGSGARTRALSMEYGAERAGEANHRVGVTKPTRSARKARRRR